MKLYKVTLRGGFSTTSTNYQTSYVTAEDSAKAYKKVRRFLDKEDICFSHEREVETVELIADNNRYSDCRTLLFI